jgi:hypothetical protein
LTFAPSDRPAPHHRHAPKRLDFLWPALAHRGPAGLRWDTTSCRVVECQGDTTVTCGLPRHGPRPISRLSAATVGDRGCDEGVSRTTENERAPPLGRPSGRMVTGHSITGRGRELSVPGRRPVSPSTGTSPSGSAVGAVRRHTEASPATQERVVGQFGGPTGKHVSRGPRQLCPTSTVQNRKQENSQ